MILITKAMAGNRNPVTINRIPKYLGGKVSDTSPVADLLCSQCGLPVIDTRQTIDCGCRQCGSCNTILNDSGQKVFMCGKCGGDYNIKETFRDKAIENELRRTSFPCFHGKCPWIGSNTSYRDHIASCKFADVQCTNQGCTVYVPKQELDRHLKSCPHKMITCRWCKDRISVKGKEQHELKECMEYEISCPNSGCDQTFPRKKMNRHLDKDCRKQTKQCKYTKHGCTFKGNIDELDHHYINDSSKHIDMIEKIVSATRFNSESKSLTFELQQKCKDNENKIQKMSLELATLTNEMNRSLGPLTEGLIKMEALFHNVQDNMHELSLLVQTLQATSYNGQFVWKIPEVSRRRDEAISGKTISLYSAPFYTNRFGYKLCLRLYMNGDGSGKGTHLSFFLTIMKGEYDALLEWPFNQMVTLMLLDQSSKKKHIVQCFKPESTSSSFWRPQSDMNVASGCPKFASLSVLMDPDFVKDDTIFFKATVDTAGLN